MEKKTVCLILKENDVLVIYSKEGQKGKEEKSYLDLYNGEYAEDNGKIF